MRRKRTTRNPRAVILTECIVALTLLGLLLTGFWYSLGTFRTFSRIQITRLRCTAAAEAQLDSLTATGQPINDETIQKLWPGVSLHVKRSAGQGKWKDKTFLAVHAEAETDGRTIRVDFSRYVATNQGRTR
ncbi:MAG: hypothetical protein JXA11_06690 [Phycisphaerae bacterium]|nr:hypothetical protein [Phycisphaerae bacterium]